MSFQRAHVAPIVPKPPPGRYDGPLTIHLNCDTVGAEIIFTLDGTVPVSNSDREHGFRCEHYKPLAGYTLKGGGSHILTVIATKKGYVGTNVQRFKYILSGDKVEKRTAPLRDVIIERRFNAMVDLDPSMPLRLARQRSPDMTVALMDTCPKAVLRDRARNGGDIALFELTHSTQVVSRSDKYRRIVAPSMSLSIQKKPPSSKGIDRDEDSLTPPLSLRSSSSQALRHTVYETPSYNKRDTSAAANSSLLPPGLQEDGEDFGFDPPEGGKYCYTPSRAQTPTASGVLSGSVGFNKTLGGLSTTSGIDASSSRALSRASRRPLSVVRASSRQSQQVGLHNSTSLSLSQSSQGGRTTLSPTLRKRQSALAHPRLAPTPSIDKRAATPSAAPLTTQTQLAVFEQRAQLLPRYEGYYADTEEQREDEAYVTETKEVIQREADRVAMLSEKHGKNISKPVSGHTSDVAGEELDALKLLVTAKDFCHSEIRKLLSLIPFRVLQQRFAKSTSFQAQELENLVSGMMSLPDIISGLKAVILPPQEAGFYDAKLFLLLCKYIIWVSRPIPEAVFGLVFAVWKTEASRAGTEPSIGKVTVMSILEFYRRTRGANQDAVNTLYSGFHTGGLPWNEDQQVSSGMFQHYVATHVPVVDAAVLTMNDMSDPMYQEPLHLWDH